MLLNVTLLRRTLNAKYRTKKRKLKTKGIETKKPKHRKKKK